MRKRKVFSMSLAWILVGFLVFGVGLAVAGVRAEKDEEVILDGGVSVMEIELNGVTLEEMKMAEKGIKYTGNQLQIDGKDFGEIEIKGRGNTTWLQEKRPWQIKFSKAVDILGITKAKEWVLLANYFDVTHLRNWVAAAFANMLDEEFVYEGKFVEVSFNGEYEGLYYLVPKAEIGKGVVDLRDRFGVLTELDNYWADKSMYKSYMGENFYLNGAVAKRDEEIQQEAMQEFLTDFNLFEKAVLDGDYGGAAEKVDMVSLVRYFLVNEFAKNPDVYITSTFMYKDGKGDKIHVGPIWDFDLAFGNVNWIGEPKETEEWKKKQSVYYQAVGSMTVAFERENFVYYLVRMPEFQQEVARVFREELSGRGAELMWRVGQQAESIRAEVLRDAEKWGHDDFEVEMEKLIEWLEVRYGYFEEFYGDNNSLEFI